MGNDSPTLIETAAPVAPSSSTLVTAGTGFTAMAKDPKDRFDSGDALANALEAATASRLDNKLVVAR